MGSPVLCRSLGLLKSDLNGLEVDDRLLDSMQKWDCLTEEHVIVLRKTPKAERLACMMHSLQSQGASKWPLLVCVFLENHQDRMAMSVWSSVKEHLTCLLAKGDRLAAMDVWEAFVRRMSVALVLDQESVGSTGGPALAPLGGRQLETAAQIWTEIVREPGDTERYQPETGLNMWKVLVNRLAVMMRDVDPETGIELWKELIGNAENLLKRGKRVLALDMYGYLVGKVKTTIFGSGKLVQDVLQETVDFMLKVQDGNQRSSFDKVRDLLVGHFWHLFVTNDRESAYYLFECLNEGFTKLEKKGAKETADALWNVLADLIDRLPKNSRREDMRSALYSKLSKLYNGQRAHPRDYEEKRDRLSSGAWSTGAAPGSCTDTDDVSSPTPPSVAPLVGDYTNSSQPTGLALVINNVDFGKKLSRRDGSEMDVLALPPLLERLGFHVLQESNLGGDGLRRAIASFADRPEHADMDAAVLAVMTHGVNEALVGVDGKVVAFQEVVDCFSNERAPNLAGKPKWLSLQACRNTSDEVSHRPDASGCLDTSEAQIADLFITFTTLPGRYAIRNGIQGTWYVQALKDVLDLPGARTLSLFEIHVKVQEFMSAIWRMEKARYRSDDDEILRVEPKLEVRTLGWTKTLHFRSNQE